MTGSSESRDLDRPPLTLTTAATTPGDEVLRGLASSTEGLSGAEARRRLAQVGPNALRSHGARPLAVLARQLQQPAAAPAAGGRADVRVRRRADRRADHLPDHRAERRARLRQRVPLRAGGRGAALPASATRRSSVRDGEPRAGRRDRARARATSCGSRVGDVVPADLRLLEADGLECDEAVLTGESLAGGEDGRAGPGAELAARPAVLRVHGHGRARRRPAAASSSDRRPRPRSARSRCGLGERQPQTAFQLGLRDFSLLLVRVTAVLTASIFVINVALGRSLLDVAAVLAGDRGRASRRSCCRRSSRSASRPARKRAGRAQR